MFDELGLDVEVPELRANMRQEDVAVVSAQLTDDRRRAATSQTGDSIVITGEQWTKQNGRMN